MRCFAHTGTGKNIIACLYLSAAGKSSKWRKQKKFKSSALKLACNDRNRTKARRHISCQMPQVSCSINMLNMACEEWDGWGEALNRLKLYEPQIKRPHTVQGMMGNTHCLLIHKDPRGQSIVHMRLAFNKSFFTLIRCDGVCSPSQMSPTITWSCMSQRDKLYFVQNAEERAHEATNRVDL